MITFYSVKINRSMRNLNSDNSFPKSVVSVTQTKINKRRLVKKRLYYLLSVSILFILFILANYYIPKFLNKQFNDSYLKYGLSLSLPIISSLLLLFLFIHKTIQIVNSTCYVREIDPESCQSITRLDTKNCKNLTYIIIFMSMLFLVPSMLSNIVYQNFFYEMTIIYSGFLFLLISSVLLVVGYNILYDWIYPPVPISKRI